MLLEPSDIDGPASSGGVDVSGGTSNANGNVFYHTFGNENGNFGSRSSGEGNYDIEGLYTFNEDYIATGGVATFDFTVIPGEITVFGNLTGTPGTLFASYSLDIFLNGPSIWDSSATIEKTAGGGSLFNESGTSLNGSLLDDRYSWNTFNESLNLGSFATGTSLNISYTLRTQAIGSNIPVKNCFSGFGGGGDFDGVGFAQFIGEPGQEGGQCGSIARIGDPNGFNQGNVTGATPDVAVPEPTAIVLLGMGLVGLGFSRKKA